MAVYIAVIAVLIVLLVASFRALSGGEAVTEDEFRTILVSLTQFVGARSDELAAALAGPRPPSDAADAAVETAAGARRKLAGYQQQLVRFEDSAGHAGPARALLSVAIEDLGWACRMVEPGTYWDNPGIQEAVTVLRRHGARCLDEVSAQLSGFAGSGLQG